MKGFFISLFFSCLFFGLHAQDVLVLLNGNEIQCKVYEVGLEVIKYKKADNPGGPYHTIGKVDVFMVKYENGTKEIFEENFNSNVTDELGRVDISYEDNDVLSKYLVEHKGKKVIYDYQIDIDQVLSAERVIYYGIEMTPLVLLNYDKVGHEERNEIYITAWVDYVNKLIPPDKDLKRWLRKEELILSFDLIHNRNQSKGGTWIAVESDGIPIEYVQELIREYTEEIEEESGIGFVIIMDSFNKRREEAIGIFCFFDIETGETLWVAKTRGGAEGIGMTKHWGIGIVNSLKAFIDEVYKPAKGR